MATGPKLDGAGTAKMTTLTEALAQLQSLHAVVERMAMELRNQKPVGPLAPQLKRVATPLASKLKAQFGLLSDQVTGMILIATRGGGDQLKVRALRENVAQLRQGLEIQVSLVKTKHAQDDGKRGDEAGGGDA
jgi:hypothetical protein